MTTNEPEFTDITAEVDEFLAAANHQHEFPMHHYGPDGKDYGPTGYVTCQSCGHIEWGEDLTSDDHGLTLARKMAMNVYVAVHLERGIARRIESDPVHVSMYTNPTMRREGWIVYHAYANWERYE